MGDIVASSESFGFSGTTGGNKEIPIPKVQGTKLTFYGVYNVTDAGISAGENFDGLIDNIEFLAKSGVEIRHIHKIIRNELTPAAKIFRQNRDGREMADYVDTQPTTTVDQAFSFTLYLEQDWRLFEKPAVKVTLRPVADEFGGASAFSITMYVLVETGPIKGNDGWYRYIGNASDPDQKWGTPDGITTEELTIGFSGAPDINYIKLIGSDGKLECGVDSDVDAIQAQINYTKRYGYQTGTTANVVYYPSLSNQYLYFGGIFAQSGGKGEVQISLEGTLRTPTLDFVGHNSYVVEQKGTVGDVARGAGPTVHLDATVTAPVRAPVTSPEGKMLLNNVFQNRPGFRM